MARCRFVQNLTETYRNCRNPWAKSFKLPELFNNIFKELNYEFKVQLFKGAYRRLLAPLAF